MDAVSATIPASVDERVIEAFRIFARCHAGFGDFMRSVRISFFPGIPKVLGFYDSFIYVFATFKANAIEKTPHIA